MDSPANSYFSWTEINKRLREIAVYLPTYFRNPVEGIKHVPQWDWPTLLILETTIGILIGVLGGIISGHVFAAFLGLIIGPVMNLLTTSITAGVMYYICLFSFKVELEFRKVFTIVILAALPGQILSTVWTLARPIGLISVVVTTLLLIIGFSENFLLDKKKLSQILGAIAIVVIIFWLMSMIGDISSSHIKVQDFTPESLDQIHKELGEGEK